MPSSQSATHTRSPCRLCELHGTNTHTHTNTTIMRCHCPFCCDILNENAPVYVCILYAPRGFCFHRIAHRPTNVETSQPCQMWMSFSNLHGLHTNTPQHPFVICYRNLADIRLQPASQPASQPTSQPTSHPASHSVSQGNNTHFKRSFSKEPVSMMIAACASTDMSACLLGRLPHACSIAIPPSSYSYNTNLRIFSAGTLYTKFVYVCVWWTCGRQTQTVRASWNKKKDKQDELFM